MDNKENEIMTGRTENGKGISNQPEQTGTDKGTGNQPEQVVVKKKKSSLGLKIAIGAIAVTLVIGGVYFFAMGGTERIRLNRSLTLANRYLEELDYEQAIAYFEEAVRIDPKNEDAYLGLAEAYIGLEDYESAAEAIEEGIKQTGAETLEARLEEIHAEQAEMQEAVQATEGGKTEAGQESVQVAGDGESEAGQETAQDTGDGEAEQDMEDEETETETEQETAQDTEDGEAETETASPSGIGEVTAGQIITFGSYEQDGNTANGKEPIEWYVLEASGGEAVLLSVYLLDHQPYYESLEATTWENCTLRSWLNSEFYNTAFSVEEQQAIINTNVVNEDNPFGGTEGGNNTVDKVWLLSLGEIERYFHIDRNVYWNEYLNGNMSWGEYAVYCYGQDHRVCAKPTAYAGAARGLYVFLEEEVQYYLDEYGIDTSYAVGSDFWWLRSPGSNGNGNSAVSVYSYGAVDFVNGDHISENNGVRPAIKVAY